MRKILEKYKAMPDTVKASIAFVICSFITKGIVFFTTPIFTRIMNIDQYGMVATYNSWVSIIEIFAVLGLTSAGVFNVGLNDNRENRNKYISICLGICNISTLLVFLLILILKLFLGDTFIISGNLLIVMFIHFLFSPAQIFWITRNRYEYKYKMATTVTVLAVLAGQALAIIGVLYNPESSAFLKILGNEIGTLLFAIPIYIIILKRGKDYVNLKEWKKILFLAIPLIPHYLAQHVMSSADRIMISKMVGNADAAIYSVVANIGMIGTIFWTAINGSLVPYTFNKLNENKYEDINSVSKKLILGYVIVCAGVMIIAPEVLKILAPVEYYPGIYIVPVITVVIFMQALYNLYANIEFYHKKTNQIAVATLAATIINIVLNYIFIPKYRYIAAAYTTLVSYIVLIFAHYINYKKCTKGKIYDNRLILLTVFVLFAFAIICIILYKYHYLIRYFLIVIIIVITVINKNRIIYTIKSIKQRKDDINEK